MDLFEHADKEEREREKEQEETGDAIQRKFLEFHRQNPQVYTLILRFIGEVKAAGFNGYSINGIFERIRWHVSVETKGDPYKLNNNFRSRYVRLIEEKHPELKGFFETRSLTAEG